MTFNIHAGHGDLTRVAALACPAGADVIALQEVDVRWSERSAFADQAAELAAACGMGYRFAPIYSLPAATSGMPPREFGVAILTRHPIRSWRNHLLTRLSTQEAAEPAPMPGFLQVTIEVNGTTIDVFDTHLDYRPDPAVRRTQVSEMLGILGESARPTILMGDMNAPPPPAATELAPLFERLRDAWAAGSGPGLTYPADAPVRRIDYIFVAGPLRALAARVLPTDASDHRPVIADLALEGR
jgi:endonuclease/exonuclease/phosphatase family metal-dependent hydrolase